VYLLQDADDAALVRDVLAGNRQAFAELVERHHRALFNVALRLTGSRDEAADATQEAFVKAFEHLGSYDARYRFFSWIYRILVNECLNLRRAQGMRPAAPLDAVPPDGSAGPLERMDADATRERVRHAILTLPPDYRQAIVLRHFAELSYEEMSAAMGVPVKTVKSRLHTARQRLAALLRDEARDR
jgi:RNA polymerase sigma-70 factor, ECF subfamily